MIYNIFAHTLNYIIIIVPVLAISVFIINFLIVSGHLKKISSVASPLMRYGHLNESLGITFITAFGSPSAASAMLRSLNLNGHISEREVIIAVLSNAFPVFVMEARSSLPVMLSFLGETGFFIFIILLLSRIFQTFSILSISRFLFRKPESVIDFHSLIHEDDEIKGRFMKSVHETAKVLKRIIKVTIPVTLITFTLLESGFFGYISIKLQFVANLTGIPPEGLGVVAAYLGSYTAAYTVAGNLLSHGTMPVNKIIITILTAKIIASLFFMLRRSVPYYIGIFGTRLGVKISLMNMLFRNFIDIGAVLILGLFL